MPIVLWCVLVAAVLPMAAAAPAKLDRSFDNGRPRDPEFWKTGFRARAYGAMANGYEAFPLFAAAAIVAVTQGGDETTAGLLGVAFLAARLGYVAAYWADRPTLRSAVWTAGFLLCCALFLTPIWAPAAAP